MQAKNNFIDVNNPAITTHKGRPPKRFKSSVEQALCKTKQPLKNNTHLNVINEGEKNQSVSGIVNDGKGRKCGKCNNMVITQRHVKL